jgi:hypothetical protein
VGLLKPTVKLDAGGTFSFSDEQRFMWKRWLVFWDEVQKVAKKNRAKVITVFNGDMVDVPVKHKTLQFITHNENDVMDMAYDTIEPALDVSDKVFVVRGTAAHVKHSGGLEERIAGDIGAEKDKDTDSWWELDLWCENVLYDISHHGRLGGMAWTKANSLNKLVGELIIDCQYRNKRVPDVVLRSHMHQYARSDNSLDMEAFALPAWQLRTEFVHRLAKVGRADIGGMYFINDKGNYTPVVKRYPQPEKRPCRN